jgi:S-adenosylmethionine hydrolase
MAERRPFISFLSDFGLDGAAATCRGVMLSICPEAQIVDIAHTVRKFAIDDGSFILAAALPYMPVGVHVAVVDPGVGTRRRPIAIKTTRGDVLIGPDNGLLQEPAQALGGAVEARELQNRDFWLPQASNTFHGRDIFSPVGAHLALDSARFEDVGERIPLDELVPLSRPGPTLTDGVLEAAVIYVDSFGNVRLGAALEDLEAAVGPIAPGTRLGVELDGQQLDAAFAATFGEVQAGASLVYRDSSGHLAIADNQASLAQRLAVEVGQRARLARSR